MTFLSLHNEPEPRPSWKGWSGSGCCVAIFLLPNPAPHLENRMTVCMGYTAMTPQGRAGKRRREGAGKPCRENGNCHPLTSCVQNEHMRRNGRLSTRWGRRNQCGQNVYIDSVRITLNLDLTFCQATVKMVGYENRNLPLSHNREGLVGDHFDHQPDNRNALLCKSGGYHFDNHHISVTAKGECL